MDVFLLDRHYYSAGQIGDNLTNKKVVFASPHSQRFEHLETYCLRLLHLCLTSYVLNLSAENKKSKTTTLMSHSSLSLYSYLEWLSRIFLVYQEGFKPSPYSSIILYAPGT